MAHRITDRCEVIEHFPTRCTYVWGEHGEHRCDNLDNTDCVLPGGIRFHACWCGADTYERQP